MASTVSNCFHKPTQSFSKTAHIKADVQPQSGPTNNEVWLCVIKISVCVCLCHFSTSEVEVRALSQQILVHLSVRGGQKEIEGGHLLLDYILCDEQE